ncbi:uncharacterized protein ColSpa_06672 [Colletotrichum spaethianum]|uniref:Uncharacterized protein n=1 Tax=Colletotrichum spaethianum TaxID=700344 RepID=A0AA37P6I5_9PEZI|nr:uncharacterized protein ColSpa_06672 [Colletotrichum spaethianum]GKT46491.1 hypothetical protein ColSpa_06672 [Colletotrichum spaethianum]
MLTVFSKIETPLSREKPDGSGPSQCCEEEDAAAAAVSRVYKALSSLARGLTAINRILGHLNLNINAATTTSDYEIDPDVWEAHRQEFIETLMEVYDATERVLKMAIRTEEYLDAGQHELLVRNIYRVCERVSLLLPQDLYNSLIGKGKEITRRK